MAPSDERAAEALREFEGIHFLHLYADRKLIHQQAYVAAARQLEHRGRLTQWSLIIGACCWAGRAVLPVITGLEPRDTLHAVLTAANVGLAVVVAASGVRLHRRTARVLSRVESLLSQDAPGGSHASSAA